MSELRWNPLLREWVITATHRQERTFLPPKDYCPLCPTKENGFPTEVPASDYDIVCFENKFPSLQRTPPSPAIEGSDLYQVEPAAGLCEVVLYTPNHDSSLGDQPLEQVYKLVKVWTDRYEELGSLDYVKYVFIFENKGEVIGVTLSHPHGQIYAFPYVPPVVAKELASCAEHMAAHGRCLICDIIAEERRDGRRIVVENASFSAVVPFFARWPYEVHIYSKAHHQCLADFDDSTQLDFAAILRTIIRKYDRLFGFSLPYIMVMHQRPTDGKDHASYHFHVEFYPPNRTSTKLKYLAGCESGAGSFITDTLAEEKAAELRRVE